MTTYDTQYVPKCARIVELCPISKKPYLVLDILTMDLEASLEAVRGSFGRTQKFYDYNCLNVRPNKESQQNWSKFNYKSKVLKYYVSIVFMYGSLCTCLSDAGTGGPGGPLAPQYLADQLTPFQPGEGRLSSPISTSPP